MSEIPWVTTSVLHKKGIHKNHSPHFFILEFTVKLHFGMKQGSEVIKIWGLFLSHSWSTPFCPAPLFWGTEVQ